MKIILICVNSEHQACNLSIIIYFNICLSEDDICTRCSPSKLDPAGPAYQKMKNSKKFDPAKSAVLEVAMEKYYNNKNICCVQVMAAQERGNFAVDTAAVRQAREEEGRHEGGRMI